MQDAAVQQEVLRAVAADARHRRLLSPAESLNALTVGATHDDASTGEAPDWFDPFERGLPSPVHAFPLPPSLIGLPIHKRLTITLAWLSPINPRRQAWRKAQLWFDPPKDQLKVARLQADYRAVQRGTLQHEILEGRTAAAFNQGDDLEIQVNCRADAGTLEERVPYALITTLEVAEDLVLDIYDEVRAAVQTARLRV